MCISLFYAQVIGLWLFFVGLAMVLQQDRFKKTVMETLNDSVRMNCAAFISLAIGLLIVVSHNIWVSAWPVVVTIYGWFMLLQGISRLFWPERFARMMKNLFAKNGFLVASWVWVVIGLFLIWAGFAS